MTIERKDLVKTSILKLWLNTQPKCHQPGSNESNKMNFNKKPFEVGHIKRTLTPGTDGFKKPLTKKSAQR